MSTPETTLKRVLLLTDVPPTSGFPAGLVLAQLCRFLHSEALACMAVTWGIGNPAPSEHVKMSAYSHLKGPRTINPRIRPQFMRTMASRVIDWRTSMVAIPRLVREAVEFGRQQNVDAVWATLEGPTLIRMALPVASKLTVPLLTQVFDPPHWWMRAHQFDRSTTRKVLGAFDEAVRASKRCAAASWAMAEEYSRDYNVDAVPVIPSLDENWAQSPAQHPRRSDDLVIGIAGQIYATAEWKALVQALRLLNWTIAGRSVKVAVLGRQFEYATTDPVRIEFMGWRSQWETIQLLSQMDVLYCPYWFDRTFEREARLSFPSKLTSYLAAGRPVFLHAPDYASPAKFVREHNAGHHCGTLKPQAIAEELTSLIADEDRYGALARHGSEALRKLLTLTPMRCNFRQFLGVEDSFLKSVDKARMEAK